MSHKIRTDVLFALVTGSLLFLISTNFLMVLIVSVSIGELTYSRWQRLLTEKERLKMLVPSTVFSVIFLVATMMISGLIQVSGSTAIMAPVLMYFIAIGLSTFANKTWPASLFQNKNTNNENSNDSKD